MNRQSGGCCWQGGVGMLSTLDYCRIKTGNPMFGADIEKQLLDSVLCDIAKQTALLDLEEGIEKARMEEKPLKCKKHPTYKAIRRPTADCEVCRQIWAQRGKAK